MSIVLNNVIDLHEKYGSKIKTDAHLILLYMKHVDGVLIDKETISTPEFLNKATSPMKIIQANQAYQILKEETNK